MTFRDDHVYTGVVSITVLFTVLSLIQYTWLETAQYVLLAVGTVVIGIPHGATDDHVYRTLAGRRGMPWFYGLYLLIALLYGVVWAVAPGFSLLLFLVISVYHFGQSNLFYTALPESSGGKKGIYLSWGAFNLATPILFRYEEAAPVIEAILGWSPVSIAAAHAAAPWVSTSLLLLNLGILFVLFVRNRLALRDLLREIAGFGVLFALYATAPLFVSFIVYWAFWHSLNSAIEIAGTWTGRSAGQQMAAFFRAAAPLTAVTFAGMALIFALTQAYGSREALVAMFFIIIAAITLPHMVIMEMLYRRRNQDSTPSPQQL